MIRFLTSKVKQLSISDPHFEQPGVADHMLKETTVSISLLIPKTDDEQKNEVVLIHQCLF